MGLTDSPDYPGNAFQIKKKKKNGVFAILVLQASELLEIINLP